MAICGLFKSNQDGTDQGIHKIEIVENAGFRGSTGQSGPYPSQAERRSRSKQFHINLLGVTAARWFNSS
jgi:hypothetical protein